MNFSGNAVRCDLIAPPARKWRAAQEKKKRLLAGQPSNDGTVHGVGLPKTGSEYENSASVLTWRDSGKLMWYVTKW